jgi:solute carrier family 24 (sodium/potassium/calcium exchanger), member 6
VSSSHTPVDLSTHLIIDLDGSSYEPWLLLAAAVAGAAVAILVVVFGGTGESSSARLARCTMGFIVAVIWIMAIADEVVEVLQVRCIFCKSG